MLPQKIILNDRLRQYIIDMRKGSRKQNPLLTADYISEQIGRAKSWLSQVENGRLKSVKKNDLINVFCYLQNKDLNSEEERKQVEKCLDDEIMYIDITQKHGIIDESGNVSDFAEMLSFQQARGHIRYAGDNLLDIFNQLLNTPIDELQKDMKKNIKKMFSYVIQWFNRAFNDTAELFSDEISSRNLYLLVETSIDVYEGNCDYFGLNHLDIPLIQKQMLKKKLDTDYFIKAKTTLKPLNDYKNFEFDDVVLHFSPEEYMTWKNKQVYIGNDPFPMVVNFKDSAFSEDNYVSYDDVNTATGLSEEKYLYIIKQIYTQFDVFYKHYRPLLQDYNELQEENDELFSENKALKKEIESLQRKLKES